MRNRRTILLVSMLVVLAGVVFAQRFRSRSSERESYRAGRPERNGTPDWELDKEIPKDVFTFVRIKYSSRGYDYWGEGRWAIDRPDAELNLAYRLQQMTSLKVHPDGKVLELTDKELFDYPFIYIVEPGWLEFSETEVQALRKYLFNGGFLMVDDFWGDAEWENFYREINRVFPDREPRELPMEHPIFHCVFDLKLTKNEMQVPNYRTGEMSRITHVTWEDNHVGDTRTVHFKGIFDDKDRMMVFIAHNTDNGDGWEREGEYEYFFREFSEKKAYPLAINVIFYAMTH